MKKLSISDVQRMSKDDIQGIPKKEVIHFTSFLGINDFNKKISRLRINYEADYRELTFKIF